jgi:hypothetical protein
MAGEKTAISVTVGAVGYLPPSHAGLVVPRCRLCVVYSIRNAVPNVWVAKGVSTLRGDESTSRSCSLPSAADRRLAESIAESKTLIVRTATGD